MPTRLKLMFETVTAAPPDPILGLSEAFRDDSRPQKINLAVGVYQDEAGKTPVLKSVHEAERRLLERSPGKSYLPIDGLKSYDDAVRTLIFGAEQAGAAQDRIGVAQTPGGTGGLRVAGDLIAAIHPRATIHLSQPTWPNHPQIFQAAGLATAVFPYFDLKTGTLDFAACEAALSKLPPGDVVVLHASCHNPTGADLTEPQWRRVADIVAERQVLPLLDFAYQGFGDGIDDDAVGIRVLAERGLEMIVCSSFSKNFSLYGERVGAVSVVCGDSAACKATVSQLKRVIRSNYSNPPRHGAEIVAEILADADLTAIWHDELAVMRQRINTMRARFADVVGAAVPGRDFSSVRDQRGMFFLSGLSPLQVDELRSNHAVYVVGNGRMNVAGLNEQNLPIVARAIAAVV